MKNSNVKINLTRKATAIASAVMTLSTAAVLAMAPMSQAQAGGLFLTYLNCAKKNGTCWYRAEGDGGTLDAAKADAHRRKKCPDFTHFTGWYLEKTWSAYGKTWYYANVKFSCKAYKDAPHQ